MSTAIFASKWFSISAGMSSGLGLLLAAVAVNFASAQTSLSPGELVVGSRTYGSVYGPMRHPGLLSGVISGSDLGVASLPVRGTGTSLSGPQLSIMVVPPARLIASPGAGHYEVDLLTGNRALLPGTDGPLWTGGGEMEWYGTDSFLAIADDFTANALGDGKLLKYELESATSTLVSGIAHGDGVVMHRPRALTLVSPTTAVVVEFGTASATSLPGTLLYSVDLGTGNRTVLSTLSAGTPLRYSSVGGVRSASTSPIPFRGTGPTFSVACRGVVFVDGHLFVAGTATNTPQFIGGILEVDLASGDRTLVGGTAMQNGVPVTVPFGSGSDPYVADAPTALHRLNEQSFVFVETFGPNKVWKYDILDRTVRVVSDLDTQVLPQFRSLVALTGLAVVPCNGSGAGFTVTAQPAPASGCVLGSAVFSVELSSAGPFDYHWRRNAVPMDQATNPSATTQSLVLNGLQPGAAGDYDCVISNACGSVASEAATLTVVSDCCDSIDFNTDDLFPDTLDIADFLTVFAGGVCDGQAPSDPPCNTDIDFNNDGLFPDTADIDSLLSVFSGGACL